MRIAIENEIAFLLQHRINNYYVDSNGCWIHRNVPLKNGYVRLHLKDKGCYLIHRLSYILYVEPIPPGMLVCHSCDIRACMNPNHLFLGTHKDNMVDASKKGRLKSNGYVQLTEDELGFIQILRERGLTQKEVARILGVDRTSISYQERKKKNQTSD